MDYRRVGSFRQRARNAEQTTKQLKAYRQQRVAMRTQERIDDFEHRLRFLHDHDNDDLPIEAEACHMNMRDHSKRLERQLTDKTRVGEKDNSSDASGSGRAGWMSRSAPDLSPSHLSALHLGASKSGGAPDVDARYHQRPPSPLVLYDYGAISARPRSVLAQRSASAGGPRPTARRGAAGFYFPGAEFRQGPYGFSMQDPIHLLSKTWDPPKETPHRWPRDAGEIRPATTDNKEPRHTRCRTAGPTVSDSVRTTSAHDRRAALAFRSVDKNNEELNIERRVFESGVFGGRWRDPLLDPVIGPLALTSGALVRTDFLSEEGAEDWPRAKRLASNILFGVEAALRANHGNLRQLFAAENHGSSGVLEPTEFLAGLVRLGVVDEGELSLDVLMEAMAYVDLDFDGRVNFSMLEHALAAARAMHRERTRIAEQAAKKQVKKMTNSYHESLPVDVIRMERQPKSLFEFQRSFERFCKQQKQLLAHHGEFAVH